MSEGQDADANPSPPAAEFSNKTVCRPDPAPKGPAGEPASAPWFSRLRPHSSRSTSRQTRRWLPIPAAPASPPPPAACGLRLEGAGSRAARPPQVRSPGRPRKRAATARHMERRPGGGEGKGKSIRSKQPPSQRLSPSLPSTASHPLPTRGPCGCSRVARIADPKATCPPAAPPPRARARRSRALGKGLSPFRPRL